MFILLQIGMLCAVSLYLTHVRSYLRRRQTQTWADCVGQLPVELAAEGMAGAGVLPAQLEMDGAKTRLSPGVLWKRLQDARIALELADFADRDTAIQPALLAWVRREAMQARVDAVWGLAGWAVGGRAA